MNINDVIFAAIEYDKGDPKRIQHFIKVHSFAMEIIYAENIDCKTAEIIETAAILHDIGIHKCEQKYGSCSGKYQEIEGAENSLIERVCYLIAHHHTYVNIDSIDWQVLVEADFLVNIYEDNINTAAVKSIIEKFFKTQTGKKLAAILYL